MENKLKKLMAEYKTLRGQSQKIKLHLSNPDDLIRLESAVVTFDFVIGDLEEILNVDTK